MNAQITKWVKIDTNTLEIKDFSSEWLEMDGLTIWLDYRDCYYDLTDNCLEFDNLKPSIIWERKSKDDLYLNLPSRDEKKVIEEIENFLNGDDDIKEFYLQLATN